MLDMEQFYILSRLEDWFHLHAEASSPCVLSTYELTQFKVISSISPFQLLKFPPHSMKLESLINPESRYSVVVNETHIYERYRGSR